MRWRIMLELAGPDGTPQRHEVSSGERIPTGHAAAPRGLGLKEGKVALAAVQVVGANVDRTHPAPSHAARDTRRDWRVVDRISLAAAR